MPPALRDRLQADIRDAKLNVASAVAAFEGSSKYPPLGRSS